MSLKTVNLFYIIILKKGINLKIKNKIMIEEVKNILKEREETVFDENKIYQLNYNFSLSAINFNEIYKNLNEDRKEREKKSLNKIDENTEQIIFKLKAEMRKELYELIDKKNNKIVNIDLLRRKRKSMVSLPLLLTNTTYKAK